MAPQEQSTVERDTTIAEEKRNEAKAATERESGPSIPLQFALYLTLGAENAKLLAQRPTRRR